MNRKENKMDMNIKLGPGKKVDVAFKGFTIKTDQSLKNGGEASAPEPFSYFLASIGSCAGIYALSFCASRNIMTDNIKITQINNFNPDKKMIDKISFKVELPPEFPAKYHKALIKSINQCSVKKHLQDPPEFAVEIIQ